MSQLRDDLHRRITEKHHQWYNDSVDLYQMAGLRAHHLAQDVFTILMVEIVGYCARFNLGPEEIADAIETALTVVKGRNGSNAAPITSTSL